MNLIAFSISVVLRLELHHLQLLSEIGVFCLLSNSISGQWEPGETSPICVVFNWLEVIFFTKGPLKKVPVNLYFAWGIDMRLQGLFES